MYLKMIIMYFHKKKTFSLNNSFLNIQTELKLQLNNYIKQFRKELKMQFYKYSKIST